MKNSLVAPFFILLFYNLLKFFLAKYISFDLIILEKPLLFDLPYYFAQILDSVNLVLIWYLIRVFYGDKIALFSSLGLIFSFWTVYYSLANSQSILILFFILTVITICHFLKIINGKFFPPTLIVLAFIVALINFPRSTNNVLKNVSYINSINTNRGIARKYNIEPLVVLIDNKVTYLGRIVGFNLISHLSPVYYFTAQARMLSFSFTPPLLVGLLIPFLFGLVEMFKSLHKRVIFSFPFLLLLVPSIFSNTSPNTEKLLTLFPIFIAAIAIGFNRLFLRRTRLAKALIVGTMALIVLQSIVVIYDVKTREATRLENYYGK